MAAIEINNLTFGYHGNCHVLERMHLQIEEGETVGIIGANGVGKSTLLKILVGLLPDYEGEVKIGGIPVERKQLEQVREKMGYVFQDSESQLFLSTVYEDVAFGPRNYGYSEDEVEERVMWALNQVHIEAWKDRQIYRMSGGQKKLASIATILSMRPEIMLFDEPTIALDPRNRRNLIRIINELEGTKIIASHDLDMILDTCDRTVLLSKGSIVKDGSTRDILLDKELLEENGLELPLSVHG